MKIDFNCIKAYLFKHWLYLLLLSLVFILGLVIRIHNVINFNTWWADDGGGHVIYEQVILEQHRLPTPAETYLAWHEPGYYLILVPWVKLGSLFNFNTIQWWAAANVLVSQLFLLVIWLLSYYLGLKNKWLALFNVFIFAISFVSVKLSAYINNELLNQTLILLLILLFYLWSLLEPKKLKQVIIWSVILAFALLIKLTSFIVLVAVIIIWLLHLVLKRQKYYLKYVFICLATVAIINSPWLFYKYQHFGQMFSINLYETMPKQGIITSYAWKYFFKLNYHFVTDYPYWYSQPHSFAAILVSDTFGDYYNLFNDVDRINALPEDQKILVGNGRFTTPQLWQSLRWTNRLGVIIYAIWIIGFIGWLISFIKQKKVEGYLIFLLIALFGGWLALIYNNLRLPYLERGVLKAHFIYYTFPILTLLAYSWWFKVIKQKWLLLLIVFVPFLVYLILAWPMIYLQ